MKLYDVPRRTTIKILDDNIHVPIGAPQILKGDIIKFIRLDGAFSCCYKDGKMVHIPADTEVEIVEELNKSSD